MYALPVITPIENALLAAQLQHKLDQLLKPTHSLGYLETLAKQIGLIRQSLRPELKDPLVLVFAADHGIADRGVSAYSPEVTALMIENFLSGGAAVSVLAKHFGLSLFVVNAGVNGDVSHLETNPYLIQHPMGLKTNDFTLAPAMSVSVCEAALAAGGAIFDKLSTDDRRTNICCFGEMGIGNTTAAAALTAALLQLDAAQTTGKGTGIDDQKLLHKQALIRKALALHRSVIDSGDVIATLAALGGFEIAMLTGAILAAAGRRVVILIDGFIVSVAALIAVKLVPEVRDYLIFSHLSAELGHKSLLAYFNARPVLQLDLRLGEASGAVLAYPIVSAAIKLLNTMAGFDQAQVPQAL